MTKTHIKSALFLSKTPMNLSQEKIALNFYKGANGGTNE